MVAADFVAGPGSAQAAAWLAQTSAWPGGRLALHGAAGGGKTHLLNIWAAQTGASLVTGPSLRPAWPAGPIAIDDADLAPDEPTLLHLLNAAAEAGHSVLLAARTPPARWAVTVPDLASRLRAITAVAVGPVDDAFLRLLLARLLSDRQLVVPPVVQDWLLARLPRDPGTMRAAAARLDRAAMAAGRPITRALASDALRDMLYDTSGTIDANASPPHAALF